MPDSTLSALSNIRTKVRRLTRNPSTAQLSNEELDSYINNFILYDMPSHIELNTFKTMFTFYTEANVDTYSTSDVVGEPLYNFKNKYANIQSPIYIAGQKATLYQSRDSFYSVYPLTEARIILGTGDGINTVFTGILTNIPILQKHITASTIDSVDNRLLVTDENGTGELSGDTGPWRMISYTLGSYAISFSSAPKSQAPVYLNTVPYTAYRPSSVLFMENKFVLRPVPDGAYSVAVTAYVRPTEMENDTDMPELSEYWQYIAVGSAIKLLQDRLDMETVQLLTAEFNNQEKLIGRRRIVQNAGKRTATIFTSGYNNDSIGDE